MPESSLYKPVARFIETEFDCFAVGMKKGTEYGTVDVVGLRYSMGYHGGSAEILAVEVKPEDATFLQALGQARAYSVMADRCYLALHKPYGHRISQEEIDMAAQLGVGLIEIGRGKSCRILVSPPRHQPIRAHWLALVNKMGYVECVICGALFPEKEMRSQRERSSIRNAVKDEKAFRYWLADLAERRGQDWRRYIYDRRHICSDCVQAFKGLAG
jgi:hypothetical protein